MLHKDKRSFFERLTGTISVEDTDQDSFELDEAPRRLDHTPILERTPDHTQEHMFEEEEQEEEGQLTVDVYNADEEIILQTLIAGVNPDDVEISITRDTVTIRGRRQQADHIPKENYIHQELYWGAFARTVTLPEEVEPEKAEAVEKHGLLTLHIPKIDKKKTQKLKVRSTL